jgi:hypothetical protein
MEPTIKYFMNPQTGSVDTEENWRDEYERHKETGTLDQWFPSGPFEGVRRDPLTGAGLVDVVRDENGDWVEADG